MLLTLLVPSHIYFTPLYLSFQSYGPFGWNLLETPLPLFLLSLTGVGLKDGLVIYIMRQFFRGYPKELGGSRLHRRRGNHAHIHGGDAARRPAGDGHLLFVHLCVEVDRSDLYRAVYAALGVIWTKLATIGSSLQLRPAALRNDNYYVAILQNTSLVLYVLPLVILFLICKRFLVESIETTGLVG